MTKHDHHNCCAHENLAYCKVCDVVYCEDCGREWPSREVCAYPQWSWTTTSIPFNSGSTVPDAAPIYVGPHDHKHEVFA